MIFGPENLHQLDPIELGQFECLLSKELTTTNELIHWCLIFLHFTVRQPETPVVNADFFNSDSPELNKLVSRYVGWQQDVERYFEEFQTMIDVFRYYFSRVREEKICSNQQQEQWCRWENYVWDQLQTALKTANFFRSTRDELEVECAVFAGEKMSKTKLNDIKARLRIYDELQGQHLLQILGYYLKVSKKMSDYLEAENSGNGWVWLERWFPEKP